MHSFHQVHKSIYHNDKQLSKNYIEWDEVRNNFKDFSNAYFIDEMSKSVNTRFLIITHHALTMSRMDRLFGVTMQEKGVSQLVSVDLSTAEKFRKLA